MNELKRTEDCTYYQSSLSNKEFPSYPTRRFNSSRFQFDSIVEEGFDFPFIVEGTDESFGLEIPPRIWTLEDIAAVIGPDTPVRIIDVASQSELYGYTLSEYSKYLSSHRYGTAAYDRARILNMISLEFSQTKLSDYVVAPNFVNSLDWVNLYWPLERIARNEYPRVQKYCLAGMAGSYTDFHIDFGGTGVWYHILWGRKRFYLIPPTEENLRTYENWTCSKDQGKVFLGDCVHGQCFTLDLFPNETLIIPSGWIHSVLTPEDSLVFGGNFLTSLSSLPQLQSFEIESRTKISEIYMFPYFREINFCLLLHIFRALRSGSSRPEDILPSKALVQIPFIVRACEDWYNEKKFKYLFDIFCSDQECPVEKLLESLWIALKGCDKLNLFDWEDFEDINSNKNWESDISEMIRSDFFRNLIRNSTTDDLVDVSSDYEDDEEEKEKPTERKTRSKRQLNYQTQDKDKQEKRRKTTKKETSRRLLLSICNRSRK